MQQFNVGDEVEILAQDKDGIPFRYISPHTDSMIENIGKVGIITRTDSNNTWFEVYTKDNEDEWWYNKSILKLFKPTINKPSKGFAIKKKIITEV